MVNKHGNWEIVRTHTKGREIKEHGYDYSDTEQPPEKGKKKQKGYGPDEPVGVTKETTKKEGPVVDTTEETTKKGKGYGGEEPVEDTEETTKKELGYEPKEPVEETTKKEEESGTEEQPNSEDPPDVTEGNGEEEGSGILLLPEETNKETENGTTTEVPEEENYNESTATNGKSSTTEAAPDDGGGATLKIKPEKEKENVDLKIKPKAEIKPVEVPLSSGVKEGKYEETVEEIVPENGEENDNTGGGEYSPNEANPTDAKSGDEETSEQSKNNGNDYASGLVFPFLNPELGRGFDYMQPAGYVQNQGINKSNGPKNRATINNQWGPTNVINERTHNEINQKHYGTGDQTAGIGCGGGNDYWGGDTVVNNQWGPTNVHNKETTNIINQVELTTKCREVFILSPIIVDFSRIFVDSSNPGAPRPREPASTHLPQQQEEEVQGEEVQEETLR